MSPDSPQYVTIPSRDAAFRRVVSHVARDTASAEQVEERLRRLYPKAKVAPRGLAHEPRIFYIYRDGRFEPDRGDAWWLRPDVARVHINLADGRFVEANEGWHALVRSGPSTLGRPYLDFILPEAVDDARVLFEAVAVLGEAHSEALLRAADGSLQAIEFHAVRRGDTIEVAYRPLSDR